MSTYKKIHAKLRAFRDERDWKQFHTPKNLAMDAVVEASELLEHFLWMNDQEINEMLTTKKREAVEDELGDILMACLLFADSINSDPLACLEKKIEKTAKKYPVEKARGVKKKYTEL